LSQKWYQKATVQGAIVAGVFVLLAAILGPLVANRFWPQKTQSNGPGRVETPSYPPLPDSQGKAVTQSPSADAPRPSQIEASAPKTPGSSSEAEKRPEVSINAPVEAPVIISQGQAGGQVAGIINNYGPPKRAISADVRDKMLAVLRPSAGSCAAFASTQGDAEAAGFKLLLMGVFRDAGWNVRDMGTFMFFGSHRGIVLTIPFEAPEAGLPQVLAEALALTGNPIEGNRGDMAKGCGAYVQVWNAPQ
jgi:hypothetical protein